MRRRWEGHVNVDLNETSLWEQGVVLGTRLEVMGSKSRALTTEVIAASSTLFYVFIQPLSRRPFRASVFFNVPFRDLLHVLAGGESGRGGSAVRKA